MLKTTVALVLACTLAAALASGALASRRMKLGIYDDAQTIGNTGPAFTQLSELRVQVVRVGLSWRASAPSKPDAGTFSDPASYSWGQSDQVVREAEARGMDIVFSILWTPGWAGGGATGNGNRAPTKMAWLQSFAAAAATRYSGTYPDPANPGALLPRVRYWTAWNEPNAPLFLKPQYKRVGGRLVVWSGRVYARMCTAVFRGVHNAEAAAGVSRGKVACGVTNPGGNNHPRGRRAAPSPLPFVRAMRTKRPKFDVFAHHPYPSSPSESPSELPSVRTRITLGNLGILIKELRRLGWGSKRVWLTEYGYQTKPPDRNFGVTPRKQAAYLKQAYRIAKRNRRVDMFVWLLLKDELEVGRWQSGLIWSFGTKDGVKKRAYAAFKGLRG
jgi:hypothetical protein